MRAIRRSQLKVASALALGACVVAPALPGLNVLHAQGRVVRARAVDSARTDSMFSIRISPEPGDIMRLIGELMASRQTEERLAMAMRDGQVTSDAARRRDLELQLNVIARRNASLSSAIRLVCAREDMQPDGYLGVNFVGIEIRRDGDGPAMYTFMERPKILSVDPGSPAQRAGIEAGDELMAIAGNDATKPVPLGALLKPGAKLAVRVSRDGQPRELTAIVAKRPDEYGTACSGLDDMISNTRLPPMVGVLQRTPVIVNGVTPSGSAGGAAAGGFTGSGGAGGAVQPARMTGGFAFVTPYASSGPNIIGGAQFLPLDAQWRETIGLDKGLLVLAVAPGSPAENAGLRKSDVILAVGDSVVTSVPMLWRMVGQPSATGLILKVQRGKTPITITFKVREPR